jgi:group I intron endonuclease
MPDSFFQRTGIDINDLNHVCDDDKNSGVYLIYNIKNERFYIGSSINLYKRKTQHLHSLEKGKHRNIFLQRDYKENCLIFYILKYTEKENLLSEEQKFIDKFFDRRDFYNMNKDASGGSRGRKVSDVTRQLISQSKKGKKRSRATKKKMSEHQKEKYKLGTHNLIGHKHSEDTKKQISESTKGENNHFFGKKHFDETKEIIRNKLTGKYYGPTVKVMAVNLTTKE